MKPVYLTQKDVPQEVKDKIVNEQIEKDAKKKALDKFILRDVLFEQELATSDEPLKIKDLIEQKEKELKTEIKIKEWALFHIGG
jgi:translation elongation factor EF-Ts